MKTSQRSKLALSYMLRRPATRVKSLGSTGTGLTFNSRQYSVLPLPPEPEPQPHEAYLFVDSIFPIHLGRFDLRRYIGYLFETRLLNILRDRLSNIKTHGFEITSLEPQHKDGGTFVRFKYRTNDTEATLRLLEQELNEQIHQQGGMPSWLGMHRGRAWVVKGIPWREDMQRFPSSILKVAFEGPDVHEQNIYNLFRPYGRIEGIAEPTPAPAGSLRSSIVTFKHIRSAAIVHNVIHGIQVQPSLAGESATLTRLRTAYQQPVQAHIIRDWISKHPKIFFPVLVFLLGSLTYTIFDPIRALMVQGKMEDWFELREFKAYKWLRLNAFDLFVNKSSLLSSDDDLWKERGEAKTSIEGYLNDLPTTVAFVHGPQGSGKTRMLNSILKNSERPALVLDCREMLKQSSDTHLVAELAKQTGYWPIFTFMNSINSLIDLASVGLIGQKTGLSSSVSEQLQEILNVVASGLSRVSSSHRVAIQREIERSEGNESSVSSRLRQIMTRLGLGDESPKSFNGDAGNDGQRTEQEKAIRKQKSLEDLQAVESLPIVVIRNFATKGGSKGGDLLDVLSRWAATLAENQIAHVIVISDNRENSKRLAKALPTKPLYAIALYDADAASALSYIKQKLHDGDIRLDWNPQQISYVERLGGRATDLESLIHKLRGGQSVEEAVEDIINRGVVELRKSAFGDDVDDAKDLPWTRDQAWAVLKLLSIQNEIPYHDLLLGFPFKGDEAALRHMEEAELIGIGTHNGRPSIIKPGKPVFRWVFERLVKDRIFQATQDTAYNKSLIVEAEAIVKACEEELLRLKSISGAGSLWSSSAVDNRSAYLLHKMQGAVKIIEGLERKNIELKKVLSRADAR